MSVNAVGFSLPSLGVGVTGTGRVCRVEVPGPFCLQCSD